MTTGQFVRITSGPFEGMTGSIVRDVNQTRIMVWLTGTGMTEWFRRDQLVRDEGRRRTWPRETEERVA